jgi:hypothetical protein
MQELFVDKMYFSGTLRGMAKRMGRPKLPPSERKRHVFSFRVTGAELERIEGAAKKAGLDAKDWARNRLLGAAK